MQNFIDFCKQIFEILTDKGKQMFLLVFFLLVGFYMGFWIGRIKVEIQSKQQIYDLNREKDRLSDQLNLVIETIGESETTRKIRIQQETCSFIVKEITNVQRSIEIGALEMDERKILEQRISGYQQQLVNCTK